MHCAGIHECDSRHPLRSLMNEAVGTSYAQRLRWLEYSG